jgi:hypothetical protein
MKATIECESEFEARCCLGAQGMLAVLRDLSEEMRAFMKYGTAPDHRSADFDEETTQLWRGRLHDLCDAYNVDLDDDC